MHFVIDAGGLLAAAAVGTAVFVPLTYVIRSSNQAPLRGIWLPIVAVWDLALCLLGWTNAWRDEFAAKALHLAIAASVPMGQLLALLIALNVFQRNFGRLPESFAFGGRANQRNADVLMHGFVLFVLTLGAGLFAEVCVSR
jgi:hypothetical protein